MIALTMDYALYWLSCAVSTCVSHSAIITFETSIEVLRCVLAPARDKDVEERYTCIA